MPTKVGSTLNLNAYTGVTGAMPLNAPQQGGSTVQGNDYRPQDFEYRDGYAWSVSTISCNPGGGTVNCLRWVKVNPATATRAFVPWLVVLLGLAVAALATFNLPMEMRGSMLMGG